LEEVMRLNRFGRSEPMNLEIGGAIAITRASFVDHIASTVPAFFVSRALYI